MAEPKTDSPAPSQPKTFAELTQFVPVYLHLVEEFDLQTASVYGVIRGYVKLRDRCCWASYRKIGKQIDLSYKTVKRSVSRLAQAGYLDVEHRPGRSSRIRIPNLTEDRESSVPRTESPHPPGQGVLAPRTESPPRKNKNSEDDTEKVKEENSSSSALAEKVGNLSGQSATGWPVRKAAGELLAAGASPDDLDQVQAAGFIDEQIPPGATFKRAWPSQVVTAWENWRAAGAPASAESAGRSRYRTGEAADFWDA